MPEHTPAGWPYAIPDDTMTTWPVTSEELAKMLQGVRSTSFASRVSGLGIETIIEQEALAFGDMCLIRIALSTGTSWPTSNTAGNISDRDPVLISPAWRPAARTPFLGVTSNFNLVGVIQVDGYMRFYAVNASNAGLAQGSRIDITAFYRLATPAELTQSGRDPLPLPLEPDTDQTGEGAGEPDGGEPA